MQIKTGNTHTPHTTYTSVASSPDSKATATTSVKESASTSQTTISGLASLLSDAATRAEKRDASNSHTQLKNMAEALLNVIDGPTYTQNKAKYDSEVPDTKNAERLQLASKATNFLNGKAANPFTNMKREQLVLIAYDDGNTFTVNERRAALTEIGVQDSKWTQNFISNAQKEIRDSGTYKKSYRELLSHYQSLPAIEQVQLNDNFEEQLVKKIATASNSSSDKDSVFTQALVNLQKQQISSMRMQISSLSLFSLAARR